MARSRRASGLRPRLRRAIGEREREEHERRDEARRDARHAARAASGRARQHHRERREHAGREGGHHAGDERHDDEDQHGPRRYARGAWTGPRTGSAGASLHSTGDTRTRAGLHRIDRRPGPRGHRRAPAISRPAGCPAAGARPRWRPRRRPTASRHTACAAGGGTVPHDPDLAALIDAAAARPGPERPRRRGGPAADARGAGARGSPWRWPTRRAWWPAATSSRPRGRAPAPRLVPVDSEHSALFQLMEGVPPERVRGGDPDGVRGAVPRAGGR